VTLHTAGEAAVDGLRTAVCCNADPYTFLGPMPARLCPKASLDGGLDVTALTRTGYVDLLRVARRALTTDRVAELPQVRTWHDRSGYTLSSSRPLPLQVDGEFVGETRSVELRRAERALTVVTA
jgi:diacylglycerol kinase family enzyme